MKRLLACSLLIAMTSTVIFFLESQTGLDFAINALEKTLPGKLQIQKIEGNLLTPITLHNLRYEDQDVSLQIAEAHLQWSFSDLFRKKLHILHLDLNTVTLRAHPTASTDNTNLWDYLHYLTHLQVDAFVTQHLSYQQNNNPPFIIPALQLQKLGKHFILAGLIGTATIHAEFEIPRTREQTWQIQAALIAAENQIHISGHLAKTWDLQWQIQVANLASLLPGLQGSIVSQGQVTGDRDTPDIIATLTAKQLVLADKKIQTINANWHLTFKPQTPSHLEIVATGIRIQDYLLKKIQLDIQGLVTHVKKSYQMHLDLALDTHPYVNLNFNIADDTTLDNYLTQPIAADLHFTFSDFTKIAGYLPTLKNPRGNLTGSLAILGTLARPIASGDIALTGGSAFIPDLGISIQAATLQVHGNDQGQFVLTGTLQAGTGKLSLQGTTDLKQSGWPTLLKLHGNNLTILNLKEYKATASPELSLRLTDKTLSIQGNITIPSATITPKDFSSTVNLPSDIVYAGKKPQPTTAWLAIIPNLSIEFTLGDEVYIHYTDLETQLRGKVTITKAPETPALANGQFYTVNGSYRAYGKVLSIQQGRLIYAGGALTNPGLNIKAVRQIQVAQTTSLSQFSNGQAAVAYQGSNVEQTVGVQVLGTLDSPIVNLFSNPALTQEDAISYLVFGVPKAQISNVSLLAALSSMYTGGQKTSFLDETKIQNFFGLSELNFESVQTFDPTAQNGLGGTTSTPSLILGKKLAPNLFFHTSIGSFSQEPTINITYQLSRHWSVQSEQSSLDTGADLLYSIERE